jgi:hypothetical protein
MGGALSRLPLVNRDALADRVGRHRRPLQLDRTYRERLRCRAAPTTVRHSEARVTFNKCAISVTLNPIAFQFDITYSVLRFL